MPSDGRAMLKSVLGKLKSEIGQAIVGHVPDPTRIRKRSHFTPESCIVQVWRTSQRTSPVMFSPNLCFCVCSYIFYNSRVSVGHRGTRCTTAVTGTQYSKLFVVGPVDRSLLSRFCCCTAVRGEPCRTHDMQTVFVTAVCHFPAAGNNWFIYYVKNRQ